jgi:hypothetical protein
MSKRPGHVVVTTEVAMCSFCGRPRTLRNEQHQLGALVRTIITCETCHRTLSSSIAVASIEPAATQPTAAEPPTQPEPVEAAEPAKTPANPTPKPAAQRKTAATKATPSKSRTNKKTT